MRLSEQKQLMIAGVVRAMPEKALRSLDMALGLTRDEALREVAGMVSGEIDRRYLRESVFAPFMPLFSKRADGLDSVHLPDWILERIWTVLEGQEPVLCEDARRSLRGLSAADGTPLPFFHLAEAAQALCETAPHTVLGGRNSVEDTESVTLFGRYLRLHKLTCKLMRHLPTFLVHMDAERQMTFRLMFRDAHDATEDGGHLFTELLFAHLSRADDMLRLMAALSNNDNDRFLARSEMGFMGERLLTALEARVAQVKRMGGHKGTPCEDVEALGADIVGVLDLMQAFDHHIDLSRDGPWGLRMTAAHRQVADVIGLQLKAAETLFERLLPMRSERVYGTMHRDVPDTTTFPDAGRIKYALDMMRFIEAMRPGAVAGGFSTQHSRLVQSLEGQLDTYFEALLAVVNGEAAFDSEALAPWFELVADMTQALSGEAKAHLIRRRTASSRLFNPMLSRQHAS